MVPSRSIRLHALLLCAGIVAACSSIAGSSAQAAPGPGRETAGAGEATSAPFVLALGPGYFAGGTGGTGSAISGPFLLSLGAAFGATSAVGAAASGPFALYLGKGQFAANGGVGAATSATFTMYLVSRREVFALSRPFELRTATLIAGGVAAPTGFEVTNPTCGQTLFLRWIDNSADETGFEVEARTPTGPYFLVAQPAANATSTTYAPPVGLDLTYHVRAVKLGAVSTYSAEAPGRALPGPPNAPEKVVVKSVGDAKTLRVHVSAPSGASDWAGVDHVHVELSTDPGFGSIATATDVAPASGATGELVADLVAPTGAAYFARARVQGQCSTLGSPAISARAVAAVQAPVVFVHGWQGSANDWDAWGGIFDAKGIPRHEAIQFHCNMDRWENEVVPLAKYIGGRLNADPGVTNWSDDEAVDLVAHSQGGLVARAMIEEHADLRKLVRSLFMLATPNHGGRFSELASFVISTDVCGNRLGYATRDLNPASKRLSLLNYEREGIDDDMCGSYPPEHLDGRTGAVTYYTFAGTGYSPERWRGKQKTLQAHRKAHDLDTICPNDGVVPAPSVMLRSLDPARQWRDFEVLHEGLAHSSAAGAFFAGKNMCDSQELMEFVADRLKGLPVHYLPQAGQNAPRAAGGRIIPDPDPPAAAATSAQLLSVGADSATTGAMRTYAVDVDSLTDLVAYVGTIDSNLVITLTDPDGNTLTPADTAHVRELSYEFGPEFGFMGYDIGHPKPGRWQLHATTASATASAFEYEWIGEGGSKSLRGVASPDLANPGDSILVRLWSPTIATQRITQADVHADGPEGYTLAAPLRDDGTSGDAIAGDGVWSAAFPAPDVDGALDMTLHALVTNGSGPVGERVMSVVSEVRRRPELTIVPGTVEVAPSPSQAGQLTELRLRVANRGLLAADSVAVSAFDQSTGDSLGTVVFALAARDTNDVHILWTPTAEGTHHLVAQASLLDGSELDLSDNRAETDLPVGLDPSLVGVPADSLLSTAVFSFAEPRPNPFRGETTLLFTQPRAGRVTLDLFDVRGRLVRTLLSEESPPGRHALRWNGTSNAGIHEGSSVYFARLRFENHVVVRRMVLIR